MEEVRAHIKQLLNQNIIRKSSSPYAAPVVIVRKHDQSIRLCVDYRQLNKKTIRDAYPLPRIEEALDTLHGTKYCTSLDLSQGYYQVVTDERDIHKTAFRVGTGGLYEYLRIPMGLSNSAATFQKIMEACFNDKKFEILLIYLDDILIFSKTVEEQLERLEFLFQRLRQHGLKLKLSKCNLFKKEIRYLGNVISQDGIRTDPDKTKATQNWKVPTNEKELRSYLELCSYYRKFLPGFSKIAARYIYLSQHQMERRENRNN
jgi:hypothetical protein